MSKLLVTDAIQTLEELQTQGLRKTEQLLVSPQRAHVDLSTDATGGSRQVLNLCANNYLGLADHPALINAAQQALDTLGLGMASVRFICGTQTLHRELEEALAAFLGTESAILFASCFDANAAIFEALLGKEDAIISDALNHASIIDGIRLCKAQRLRYPNNDMEALEHCLQQARDARYRVIVSDGVFSMDGCIANVPQLVALAERHDALLMIDDSHAVGFVGPDGSGTPAHFGLKSRVDLLSGTFGKALGGAAGGYIAGPAPLVDMLRQRARPYLFSNALPPAVVAATLKALALVRDGDAARATIADNAAFFRQGLTRAGFRLVPGEHAIIPVLLGDAVLAQRFAAAMLDEGVYVVAFAYPVVPHGQARIRTQMSAAHTREDLQQAIDAFVRVGKSLDVV